jgi:hypothetical protein
VTVAVELTDLNPNWVAWGGDSYGPNPIPTAWLEDTTNQQIHFICVPKGPGAPPLP